MAAIRSGELPDSNGQVFLATEVLLLLSCWCCHSWAIFAHTNPVSSWSSVAIAGHHKSAFLGSPTRPWSFRESNSVMKLSQVKSLQKQLGLTLSSSSSAFTLPLFSWGNSSEGRANCSHHCCCPCYWTGCLETLQYPGVTSNSAIYSTLPTWQDGAHNIVLSAYK